MVNPDPPKTPSSGTPGGAHPAPDLLVGWAEGTLLPGESGPVEAHLAACDPCRALVAELAPSGASEAEAAPDPFVAPPGEGTPARGPRPVLETHEDEVVERGHVGMWEARFKVAFLAAAGLVLLALLTRDWRDDRPRVEWVASAGSAEALFGEVRSGGSATDDLYVGLRVDRDAHLRLLAVLDDGSLLAVPLDTAGSFSLALEGASKDYPFGPYPRAIRSTGGGDERRVRWFLALLSADPIAVEDESEPWWFTIHRDLRVTTRQELEQLGVRLEDAHGAESAVVTVEP